MVFPIVLGIALISLTPVDTFLIPAYWIGIVFWTSLGAILIWHEVSRQAPEAEYFRGNRSRHEASRSHWKWLSLVLLMIVLGSAKLLTGASPDSAPGAFAYGLAGAMLSMGVGYVYEITGREKLLYCEACEGHRWFIRYQGAVVCGVCGHTWNGVDKPWTRPATDSTQRRIRHEMVEFFGAGPLITFAGMFGVLALPEVGLSDWTGIPLLMMFGGLVSTVLLGRRARHRIVELREDSDRRRRSHEGGRR